MKNKLQEKIGAIIVKLKTILKTKFNNLHLFSGWQQAGKTESYKKDVYCCKCEKNGLSWTDKIKNIMGEFKEIMWAMFTGDTSTNLVDKKFEVLLKDSEFSNELYTKVHDNKEVFEIEKDGKKHKYRKIKI